MAITPGIGLFITIIGLKNAGLVVGNSATLVSMVDFAQWRSGRRQISLICGALVALVGLIVIGVLHARNVKGSSAWYRYCNNRGNPSGGYETVCI